MQYLYNFSLVSCIHYTYYALSYFSYTLLRLLRLKHFFQYSLTHT